MILSDNKLKKKDNLQYVDKPVRLLGVVLNQLLERGKGMFFGHIHAGRTLGDAVVCNLHVNKTFQPTVKPHADRKTNCSNAGVQQKCDLALKANGDRVLAGVALTLAHKEAAVNAIAEEVLGCGARNLQVNGMEPNLQPNSH